MGTGKGINWRTLREDEFNNLVESLIVKDRTINGLVAQAIDGRGGDGGIDIDIRVKKTWQLTEILQLKFFPEGFSNGFKTRKRQIKSSFERAMDHKPAVWTLVIPANLTVQERKYLSQLKSRVSPVQIRFLGSTELDNLCAKHPDIHSWALRDTFREALEICGRGNAGLNRPGDLSAEVQHILDRSEARSQYWRTDLSVKNGVITESFYPKRDDAHDREPLGFSLILPSNSDEVDMQKFRDAIEFGAFRTVEIYPPKGSSLIMNGPDWFAGAMDPYMVEISPPDSNVGARIKLSTVLDDGSTVKAIRSLPSIISEGVIGRTLLCPLPGGISLIWRLSRSSNFNPTTQGAPGALGIEFNPLGHTVSEVNRALTFIESINNSDRLVFDIDGEESYCVMEQDVSVPGGTEIFEFIQDLVFIENELDIDFDCPDGSPSEQERVWMRSIRMILEGRCPLLPDELSKYLIADSDGDSLESSLGVHLGSIFHQGELELRFMYGGTRIVLEGVNIFSLLHGMDASRFHKSNSKLKVLTNPSSGLIDRAAFMCVVTSRRPIGLAIVPEPWNLYGIPEHKDFERLSALWMNEEAYSLK